MCLWVYMCVYKWASVTISRNSQSLMFTWTPFASLFLFTCKTVSVSVLPQARRWTLSSHQCLQEIYSHKSCAEVHTLDMMMSARDPGRSPSPWHSINSLSPHPRPPPCSFCFLSHCPQKLQLSPSLCISKCSEGQEVIFLTTPTLCRKT